MYPVDREHRLNKTTVHMNICRLITYIFIKLIPLFRGEVRVVGVKHCQIKKHSKNTLLDIVSYLVDPFMGSLTR